MPPEVDSYWRRKWRTHRFLVSFSDEAKAAYSRLLDRDENSAGGGDVGASVRWPSPLYATDDHRIVANEMASILGGSQYDYAYIAKYGGDVSWQQHKNDDKAALESWAQDSQPKR